MNFHPILVHFPIACLVLYTMVEVLSFFNQKVKTNLLNTKYFLLFVGIIGTFIALQSGEIAEHALGRSALIETHSQFANATYASYMIIAIFYLVSLILQYNIASKYRTSITQQYLPQIKSFIANKYTNYGIVIISIIGFVLLSITGALGGAISHGSNADIIVQFVYKMIMQ